MKIFLTGASGFVGSAVLAECLNAGHDVICLARNEEQAGKFQAMGAAAHPGDLNDLKSLRKGAEAADAVIHTAFNHDFTRFKESCEDDRRIIRAYGEVLAGSERPLIITSGIGILSGGHLITERDMPRPDSPNPRLATEQAIDEVAATGVRVAALRLPPSVHGEGDHGFIPMLINIAREKGLSVYDEERKNNWPAVHRSDAAKLYLLAVQASPAPGTRYHAVGEEGIPFREIAEAIGDGLKVPVVSRSGADAATHFGWFAHFAAMNVLASAEITKRATGWQPSHQGLIEDIKTAKYF